MAFDFSYPNTPADQRGWGQGWKPGLPIGTRPASYTGTIVPLSVRGVPFVGGIREELAELCELLVEESLDRGYIPKLDNPGCWGGAFRPTKRSDGSYTTTPSNHSWYTAVDINAPHNVYGSTQHQIPEAMAKLWHDYGWRWLGPPINDWEHFDFAGTPADAKAMLDKARKDGIGMALSAEDKQTLAEARKFLAALDDSISPAGPVEAGTRVGRAVKKSEKPDAPAVDISAHIADPDAHAHKHALGNSGLQVKAG